MGLTYNRLLVFVRTLGIILEEVEKLTTGVKSKRMRRKVVVAIFGESQSSVLQKCVNDLDWAIKEFEVTAYNTKLFQLA